MKSLIVQLLLILSSLSAFGQKAVDEPIPLKERLQFYLIDDEAGLSNNTINNIVQDSSGFIWIGTIEGLNRYDGNNFVHFRNYHSDTTSLLNNFVQNMYVNKTAKIWISTDGGLNVYDGETETFEAYTQTEGLIENNVNSIIPGPEEAMIAGIYRGGVHIIYADGSFENLIHNPQDPNTLSSDEISSLAMQGDSVLWVGTFDGGINKVSWRDKKVRRISHGNQNTFSSPTINHLYTDKVGNIWIGSKAGVHVIKTNSDTLFAASSVKPGQGLSDSDVLCIREDDMGRIWIGTRNGGLNIIKSKDFLDETGERDFDWYLPRDDGESVFNRTISTITKDNDGNMWLGTSTGINFVNPHGEKIVLLTRNPISKETLAHNRISSLEREENGNIWIGTDGGGLNLFNPDSGKFLHFFHKAEDETSLSNDYILSLKKDSRGRLWAGTYRGGINRVDPLTGKATRYLQGTQANGSDVRTIIEDSKKRIWVGTNQGGLYLYQEREDAFHQIQKSGSMDIRDIHEDETGALWLATFGSGICYYDPKTDSLRIYNSTNVPGLPSNIIFSLLQTDSNSIWAGARYGGLMNLNFRSGKVTVYSEQQGLCNNTITSMVLEDKENIWIGTLNGISNFSIPEKKFTTLNSAEGIKPGELNIGAVIKSTNGTMYFGGNKGLIVFQPKAIKNIVSSSPVILTGLKIFNKPVPVTPNQEKGTLRKAISHQEEIVLSYDQTLFSIDFAALSYPFSERISYSYILENYNDYWVESGNVGTANFSNIPPGKYTFKVKASGAPGSGKEEFTTLDIVITPPFWRTWPAYLAYMLVLAILIYGALKYYSERIKLRNSLLFEKKQRHLEHDINEERLRFFTNFSHELKTPLTLILAPVEDLLAKAKDNGTLKSLGLAHKNAKYLLQLINKLLEFRKSEVGLNQLKLGEFNLDQELAVWAENYQPLAAKKKVLFTYNSVEKDLMVWLDVEKVQIMVYNLLSNAFKFTPPQGSIELSLSRDNDYVYIKIKDTGYGIAPSDLPSIFNWYYKAHDSKKAKGTGIGLALSKRLAELHHGDISVSSTINEGSEFIISLPFEQQITHPVQIINDSSPEKFNNGLELPTFQELLTEPKLYEEKVIHLGDKKRKELILLIDDNPGIIQYLNDLLKDEYDIINADNGRKGFEKANKYVPDLVISDVMMPGGNGIEFCKSLKQNSATTHIPVILLSVNDNVESLNEGFEEGADQYITKPFNGQLLKTRIKSLLAKRKQLREYFNSENKNPIDIEDENSPLFKREKKFLEALENTILVQMDSDETNVEAIAHAMGMSRTSLYRKIKAVTGQNINEYLRSAKIRKAAKLISENGYNVSQAAFEVGFSSVKYFRKLFKEQIGKLPSDLNKGKEVDEENN